MTSPYLPWGPLRRGVEVQVFAFAHAGGGAACFQGLARALPPSFALRPVLLPGREMRIHERPFLRMTALVDSVVSAIGSEFDEAPCIFFGHSLGAKVAWEVARTCRSRRLVVLVTSACRSPSSERPSANRHQLPDDSLLAEVAALGGLPREVLNEPALLRTVLPALRGDYALLDTYRPTSLSPLDSPILAVGGAEDEEVSSSALRAWSSLTTKWLGLSVLPGGHFYFSRDPAPLATLLTTALQLNFRPGFQT